MTDFDFLDSLPPSTPSLLIDIDAQRDLMIAVATGGPRITDAPNADYRRRREAICDALNRLGIKDPNPHEDLWAWYGRWSSGDLPTYQSRRQYIRELYSTTSEFLRRRQSGAPDPVEREPTGWARVDRCVDKVREGLAEAENEEDFQAVGLLCREALISLAQAVYDPSLHSCPDGVVPSETDASRMLEAYIDAHLAGGTFEAARRHAKASLSLANDLQHRRTAQFRDAALCAEATSSVMNIIAIVSGRRDPDYF